MKRALSIVKFLIGWPLGIVAFLFVLRFVLNSSAEILPQIDRVNPLFLLLAFSSFVLCYLLRTFTWQELVKDKGHKIPFKETLYRWEFSEIKRYVPGNVWSFLGRANTFEEVGVPKKISAQAIFAEIELVVLACFLLSFPSIPLISEYTGIESNYLLFLFLGLGVVGTALFLNTSSLLKKLSPDFSLKTKIKSLIYYLTAFSFFGLGTYLAALSVVDIKPELALPLIGFFNFALLVGYLSIITPSGLGVREGIIAFGLSRTFTIGTAGFIGLFTRLVLVMSELIYASFLLLVYKRGVVKKYIYEIILALMTISYGLYFTIASFLKYENFYTGRFDLGNMSQTVWNTAHGRIFELTDPNGTEIVSRLAFHADFILILLAPFYFIWEDPRMLLLIQTLVLSLGGIFVYLIAKEKLKNKLIALIFAFAFFINPAVNYTNLFDFHAVTLSTTFLLGAFYFIMGKKHLPMLLMLILAAITKEQVWVIVSLVGIYLIIFEKQRKLGAVLAVSSALIFYLLVWIAIPKALGSHHFALEYYSDFGESPAAVIKNVILSPIDTLKTLLLPDRLGYLKQLFLPLGYMALIFPFFLIFAGPDLLINLLSSNSNLHEIYYQYSANITPFIFLSAIYAIFHIRKRLPEISLNMFGIIILLFALISAYDFGPLPLAKKPTLDMFTRPQVAREEISGYLKDLPQDKSVSASNNLGSQLSHRREIYTIPNGISEADFVMFLITPKSSPKEINALRQVLGNPAYRVELIEENFYVFKKL